MRNTAPWPDFEGTTIMEGDRLIHPSGEMGIVAMSADALHDNERWRIDYGNGVFRSLQIEVGEEGRAVVLDETGMHF
jgi:hypothetical protein